MPEFRAGPQGQGQVGRMIESLTVSPDGRYLYAAMEGALAEDGDSRGRNMLRIQRYVGTPGGSYRLDQQYAYQAKEGMYLAELAAAAEDRLLAPERPRGTDRQSAVGERRGNGTCAPWTTGPHDGQRPLYLVSDDNTNSEQTTRLYALSVRLP
ncbi:esterase-like activity of phytase family protein [Streptomyces sp. NPDC001219]